MTNYRIKPPQREEECPVADIAPLMDQVKEFIDSRNKGFCIHCGALIRTEESSRDHVPTKGLLNPPHPYNLPVVEVCRQCNVGFSSDEEYLIAFLGSVLSGSTRPDPVRFHTAAGILNRSPVLGRRIDRSQTVQGNLSGGAEVLWEPELDRIERVIVKNARGHVLYEIGEPILGQPSHVGSCPIPTMRTQQVAQFENVPSLSVWPEIGSRMFVRGVLTFNDHENAQGVYIDDGWPHLSMAGRSSARRRRTAASRWLRYPRSRSPARPVLAGVTRRWPQRQTIRSY